jgi:hypothetical protein
MRNRENAHQSGFSQIVDYLFLIGRSSINNRINGRHDSIQESDYCAKGQARNPGAELQRDISTASKSLASA